MDLLRLLLKNHVTLYLNVRRFLKREPNQNAKYFMKFEAENLIIG